MYYTNYKKEDFVAQDNECKHTQYISGHVALMCPHCHHLYYRTFNRVLEEKLEVDVIDDNNHCDIDMFTDVHFYMYNCTSCGREIELVQLDPNIANSIQLLNKMGFTTKFCCEGHGPDSIYADAYVMFNHHQIDQYLYSLPNDWYVDDYDDQVDILDDGSIVEREVPCTTIRSDNKFYPANLDHLYEWCRELEERVCNCK